MGGVILVVAFKLIDFHHIREIFRSSRSDTLVLLTTFLGTLFFEIDFAIYTGMLLSLAIYLTRTSHPHVDIMAPNPADPRRQLTEVQENHLRECPQLKILCVHGSLFFGAANHISEIMEEIDADAAKYLLIVGYGINFVDVSGAMVLVQEAQRRSKVNRNLYLCRLNREVYQFLENGGFLSHIHKSHIFCTEFDAIAKIYTHLDRRICLRCEERIFEECREAAADKS
jgi:SulP family sulfate permease